MEQQTLIQLPPSQTRWLNGRVSIRDEQGMRLLSVSGIHAYRYHISDLVTEKFAVVSLVEDGFLRQEEAARGFGYSVASVRRWQRGYEALGVEGLDRKKRTSPLIKMGGAKDKAVRVLFNGGMSNRGIAARLGVNEITIRRTLKRLCLQRKPAPDVQLVLDLADAGAADILAPHCSAEVEADIVDMDCADSELSLTDDATVRDVKGDGLDETSPELPPCREVHVAGSPLLDEGLALGQDVDPMNRTVDRLLASQGLLKEAAPLFGPGREISGAGVLLIMPLLVKSGLLDVFRAHYPGLKPGFYGLRSVLLTLLFMALLRIKRPENLKEVSPLEFGSVLGLDRSPEVKTLRRKLSEMAQGKTGAKVMRALAKRRLEDQPSRVGFLHLDGHVREYHGKGLVAKGHISRTGMAAKATTDTWVNDAFGDPLFLVTSELNEGLSQVLEGVAEEVFGLIGRTRRWTMVFDRGGWNRGLFARLIANGVDILTYRKGHCEALPTEWFQKMTDVIGGKAQTFTLHDQSIYVGTFRVPTGENGENRDMPLWLRQVTLLCENGHQVQVVTSRQDLSAVEILWRMFNRWRQENFFKYMRQEYAIDALVEYEIVAVDHALDRPNPDRKRIEKELSKAQAEETKLTSRYGKLLVDNPTRKQPAVADFKLANQKLGTLVAAARAKVQDLKAERDALPERVSAATLERLSPERKLITDTLKIAAYQIESDMVRMLTPEQYPRIEQDGRKLIVAALKSKADIEPVGKELRVTLPPQSAPHRDRAIHAICQQLNAMNVVYPGTSLRLRYAVAGQT